MYLFQLTENEVVEESDDDVGDGSSPGTGVSDYGRQ